MAKLTLSDITTGLGQSSVINSNNALIEQALENTVSRDGTTPNTLTSDLDVNSNSILNTQDLTLNGGLTLNGVARNTWPSSGNATQDLTGVLTNGEKGNLPAAGAFELRNNTGATTHFAVDEATGKVTVAGADIATLDANGEVPALPAGAAAAPAGTVLQQDGTWAQRAALDANGEVPALPAGAAAAAAGAVLQQDGSWVAPGLSSGVVAWFAANSPVVGWLKCDGSAVSRTTYAALFSAIGTTFGTGDGLTTFNLPDLRGEFIRGWDNGRGIDNGRTFGSVQLDAFKSHTHTVNSVMASGGAYCPFSNTAGIKNKTSTATGGSETRPRNIALLPMIKY